MIAKSNSNTDIPEAEIGELIGIGDILRIAADVGVGEVGDNREVVGAALDAETLGAGGRDGVAAGEVPAEVGREYEMGSCMSISLWRSLAITPCRNRADPSGS